MGHDALNRFDVRRTESLVRSLVARGVVTEVDASAKMQSLGIRLESGHRPSRVEHWERYGLTAHPHAGAEVLALAVNGNRDHVAVLDAADRRYRVLDLAAGEVAVYDDQGQKVVLTRSGVVVDTPKAATIKAGEPVTIEAPGIHLKGAVQVTGDITQTGKITSTGPHIASGHL